MSRPCSVAPLISFVVATKNAAAEIGDCISNFRKFEIPIQVIIKDGLSTDNTIKIVEQNLDRVDCLIQRADAGVYSAWNQALSSADGAYVAFCGADDRPNPDWYLNHVDTFRKELTNSDLIYGDLVKTLYGKFRKYRSHDKNVITAADLTKFWLPHPGLLHRAALFHESQFREDFKLAGDYYFILSAAVRRGHLNVLKLEGAQCVMHADGMSHSPNAANIYEREFCMMREELKVEICAPSLTADVYFRLNKIAPKLAFAARKTTWIAKGSSSWQSK